MGWTRALTAAAVFAALLVGVEAGSAVSPGENGKIAFASARDQSFEIYSINPDSTAEARVTNDPGADTDPAWSPDGKRIAFTTNRNGNDDIYLMNADGSGQVRLTTSPASDTNPTWSPGGRNIAFASNRDGDSEIFVMNEDGTGETQLTSNAVPDATPAWSPDQSRIAFRSERDGNSEIYVMNVDGTDTRRLTSSPGADVSPSWSPDGTQIAFASNRDGNWEIYAMNADGSDPRRLTRNLDRDLDPSWSPNGRSIAFMSDRDANTEIYLMNADGSGQTRLTTDPAEDTTPDWQWQDVVLPPPRPVEEASFRVRWKESRVYGALEVAGRVPGVSRIQLALRRGGRVYLARGLVLPKGSFSKRLSIRKTLLPGGYLLDVTADRSPTALSPQTMAVNLGAPPEGVVSSAWASAIVGGPPMARIPATNDTAFAHFRFAALPRPGQALVAHWYRNGRRVGTPVPRRRSRLVITFVRVDVGTPLPVGVYSCVLRAGGKVVERLTFRVA